jgi:hypothetical protein
MQMILKCSRVPSIFLLLALSGLVPPSSYCAVGFPGPKCIKPLLQRTELSMGWLDFKPVQGSGSGKDKLDEQWEAQQAMLRARRAGGIDKEHLKNKYKNTKENQFNKMLKENESKKRDKRVDDDVIVTEDVPKWFWEK